MTEAMSTAPSLPGQTHLSRLLHMIRGSVAAVLVVAAVWQALAMSGTFPTILLPPIETVAETFVRLVASGELIINTGITLGRMLSGYSVAVGLGVTVGLLMGRFGLAEELGSPLVAFLLPIPSLALVPLFTIWFGLGSTATIVLVIFVATPPIVMNTWTGVKSIEPVLFRAASSMGVRGTRLFVKVVIPAALPFILTGLRFGLSIAWRAVIAGELISATETGLGWMLFDAREWLRADVMFATLFVMAVLGLAIEKIGFAAIDRYTVERWGMVTQTGNTD